MIIDGKKIAEEMLAELAEEMKVLRQTKDKPPRLAAVMVAVPIRNEADAGWHQISNGVKKFLELKKKAAEKVGIDFRIYEFPANITTQKLHKEVADIAKAGVNHGVLVELPLPLHINTQYIINAVPQEKDVDVLSEKSQGAFLADRSLILPPAVEAVKIIFEKYDINPKGKNCAVFGYGLLVGKPIGHWLASQGATVSIINEFTSNPAELSCHADIIVAGTGQEDLITKDMIKEGSVIIDFAKDVDFDEVSKKASWITPVPGGVGPIVIAAVLKNLLTLYKKTLN